jgi:dsDNA-specific endonuclease/ATPase MutS2
VRLDVKVRYLGKARGAERPPPPPAPAVPRERRRVPLELNLIGRHVDEAIAQLEAYLDAALLARLPAVRIVHGYGTGALRKAVHDTLRKAGIESFRLGDPERDPGGGGVTLVDLDAGD